MPEVSLDWIILVMFFLISVGLVYFMLMSRFRARGTTRELEVREGFSLLLKRRMQPTPVPKKLKKALGRAVKALEGAAAARRAVVRVRLDPRVKLRAETPDIISLRMPTGKGEWVVLHKSLGRARIKRVKKVARGYEVRLVIHRG
ncbi:MAG: hypothetical protein ACE5OT_03640 [Candidatus Hadarchaeaceae archaeon]